MTEPTKRGDDPAESVKAAETHLDDALGDAGNEPVTETIPNIHQAIIGMMREVKSIAKTQKNLGQGGYMFRGIDDVYNFVHPHLCKWGVYLSSEILEETHVKGQTSKGNATNITILRMRYKLTAEDGTFATTEVSGEATDSNDKSTAKALSMAYKYAFFQLMCIPIEQFDGDSGPEAHPNPPANRSAPKAKPRGDRGDVSHPEVKGLFVTWQERHKDGQDNSKFAPWVHDVTGHQFKVGEANNWSRFEFQKCCDALEAL
jgi:hypothetical protein